MTENTAGGQSERYEECQLQATITVLVGCVKAKHILSTNFIWHVSESLKHFLWPLCQYNYNILNSWHPVVYVYTLLAEDER